MPAQANVEERISGERISSSDCRYRGRMKVPSSYLAAVVPFALVAMATACGNAPTPSAPNVPSPARVPTAPAPAADAASVVDAADRSAEDRALDAGRKPKELLAFLGVTRGMKVGEIAAGTGYTTELLARAVGPEGKVYAENNRFVVEKFADKPWAARLAKPVNANVVRVDRELDAPFPPEVKDLDVVVDVLFYHDTVWMKTDRAAMNRAIFAALKPGGAYVIVDHSGRAGTGTTETDTLHRIEEKVVRDEVKAAGFVFEREGTFLKNAEDARDWNASPRAAADKRGTSDRFVLRFTKPR
jgi:predicted methyltransferase